MFPLFRRALLGVNADRILLAYKKRLAVREVFFFRTLSADFELRCLPQSALQPELRNTGVHLLVVIRKRRTQAGEERGLRLASPRAVAAAGVLVLAAALAAKLLR
jgi:hypothetical protein